MRPVWQAVLLVLLGLFFGAGVPCVLALEVPPYRGYVNDYADMIAPETEARLERVLHSFELTDSTQVAVLTIPSLQGGALEEFSIRTVDRWQVGQQGRDNGVLLLVARDERSVRIEVGRGLEPVLTDLLSGRIIDHVIRPRFTAGRFDEGFEAGVAAIIQATRGEFTGETRRGKGERDEEPPPLLKLFVSGFFLTAFLGNLWRPLGAAVGALLFPLAFLLGLLPVTGLVLAPFGALAGWLLPLVARGMLRGGIVSYGGGPGRRYGGGGQGFRGFGGGGFGGGGASGGW